MRVAPVRAEQASAPPQTGDTRSTKATARHNRPNGLDDSAPRPPNGAQPKVEIQGLSIRIPMTLRRRGGRRLVIVPDGLEASAPRPAFDPVLINALVRAHRWRRQIESGQFRSASELATHEKLTDSFVARMLCLTLLAPDITQAILEGRQPKGLKLATLLRGMPLAWEEQRRALARALPKPNQ